MKDYKKQIQKKLRLLTPIFARASVGDFSRNINLPDQDDEFLELFSGIQIMLEVIRDKIDRLENANRELQRQNRTMTAFTAMVSHEVKTPLSAIKQAIEIMLDEIDGPLNANQHETLWISKNNVDRLNRMVNNVLTFPKLEYGQVRMNWKKKELKELITRVYRFLEPTTDKKAVRLLLSLPKRKIFAVCDSDKIEQVVINLIDNALKFTKTGGEIRVKLHSDGKTAKIDIQDTGSGIQKKDQKKIFKLFNQGSVQDLQRTFGETSGWGIGLTVCRLIMKHHDGRVEIRSAPKKGSLFRLSWPILRSPGSFRSSPAGREGHGSLRPKRAAMYGGREKD